MTRFTILRLSVPTTAPAAVVRAPTCGGADAPTAVMRTPLCSGADAPAAVMHAGCKRMLSADAELTSPARAPTYSGAGAPATIVRITNKRASPDGVDCAADLHLARTAFNAAVKALVCKHAAPDFGSSLQALDGLDAALPWLSCRPVAAPAR